MIPYEVLAELVKNYDHTFREEWVAFARWEELRYFHDDPSSKSKEALNWLLRLDELCQAMENEYLGPGKERGLAALEAAFVAFSQLDLPDELCSAIRKWRGYRLCEELVSDEGTTIGEQRDQ